MFFVIIRLNEGGDFKLIKQLKFGIFSFIILTSFGVSSEAFTFTIDGSNIGDGSVYELRKIDINTINTDKTVDTKDLFTNTKLTLKDGKSNLEIKEPGLYELVNLKRAPLYNLDKSNFKFRVLESNLTDGSQTYKVKVDKIKTDVVFKVVGPDSKPLGGVSVKLSKLNEPRLMSNNFDVSSWQKASSPDVSAVSDENGNVDFKDLTEGSYKVEQMDSFGSFVPEVSPKTFNVELANDYSVKVSGSDFLLKNYNKVDIKSGFSLFTTKTQKLEPSKSIQREIRVKLNENVKHYKSLVVEDLLDDGLDISDFIDVSGAVSQTLSKKNVLVGNKLVIPFDQVLKDLNTSNDLVITYNLTLKNDVQDINDRSINSFVNVDSGLHYKERISADTTKIKPVLGSINFRSLGKDKKPYLDTEFKIYIKDSKGKVRIDGNNYSEYKYNSSGVLRPNANGYVIARDLKYGTYLVKQTKVSSGYKMADDYLLFEVNSDQIKTALPDFITLKYIETKQTFNILVSTGVTLFISLLALLVYLISSKKKSK